MFIITIILYCLITLPTIVSIVLYGHRPSRSLGWILLILIIPFLGALLYLLFGVNRREFKIFTLKHAHKRRLYDKTHGSKSQVSKELKLTSNKNIKIASLLANSSGFLPFKGNKVTILNDGKKTFDKLFMEIEKAKSFIHIQYFIIEEGILFDKLCALCEKKINEKVEIRIIYDAIGSFKFKRTSINRLRNLGVEIYPISPLKIGTFLFALNYRNHRKILVIDGKIGFIGGVNMSDKYIKPQTDLGVWDDEHLCIEGPAVKSLHQIFIKDFFFASGQDKLLESKYLPKISTVGNSIVQIVASGPDSIHSSIMQQYIALIHLAQNYIYIANPYFMPSRSVLEALKIAALSGINIKLLVPKRSDSWLAKNGMFSYFKEILSVHVEIHLSDDFLHSKLIIIDDEFVSVGSGNFDHRSFEQNFESNALIYDAEVATKIGKDFIKDCNNCNILTIEEHESRSLKDKLQEGIARLFSPLL